MCVCVCVKKNLLRRRQGIALESAVSLPDRSTGVSVRGRIAAIVDKGLGAILPRSHGGGGAGNVFCDADAAGGSLFAEDGELVLGDTGERDGLEFEVERGRDF